MDEIGFENVTGFIDTPLGAGTVGAIGGLVVGATAGALVTSALSKPRKKRSSKSKRKKVSRSRSRRKQRKPYTAGKSKDRSRRRIRYTKNNQPYIIQANGRARFISKSSARRSRKMKGGRY